MVRTLIAALIAVLVGCASVSPAVRTGTDTYMLSVESPSGIGGHTWPSNKQLALKNANDHCDRLGKELASSHFVTHGTQGFGGMMVEIYFECQSAPR